MTKRVAADQGVSYGLTYRTASETTLALIPVGYGDGIPRAGSSRAKVWVNGKQHRIVGRVAMDQVVIDVGDEVVMAGDEVILFGDGRRGEPTAADWATACDTIDYEIVTRISPRVPRRLIGDLRPNDPLPNDPLANDELANDPLPNDPQPHRNPGEPRPNASAAR